MLGDPFVQTRQERGRLVGQRLRHLFEAHEKIAETPSTVGRPIPICHQVAKKEQYLLEKHKTRIDKDTGIEVAKRVPTDTERYRISWKDFVARAQGKDVGDADIMLKEEFKGPDYDARRDAHTFPHLSIPREKIAFASKFTPAWNTYYAIYFTMTGLHGLHVMGGMAVNGYFALFGKKMWDSKPEMLTNRVENAGLFWHFVDLVWIFLFPILYLL